MTEERRRAYRFPAQPGLNAGLVRIGRKELTVQLIDESASGFSILAIASAELKLNQQLELRIHSGRYLTSVSYLEPQGDQVRVGLHRVRDLPATERKFSLRELFIGSREKGRSPWGLTVAIALVLWIGALFLFGRSMLPPEWGGTNRYEPSRESLTADFAGRRLDRKASASVQVINSLTSPQMIRSLNLSDTQQRDIDRIFDDTARSLAALYAEAGSSNSTVWSERSAKIVEKSLQRFLCSLTERQIKQWVTMLTLAKASEEATPDELGSAS